MLQITITIKIKTSYKRGYLLDNKDLIIVMKTKTLQLNVLKVRLYSTLFNSSIDKTKFKSHNNVNIFVYKN